MSSHLARRWWVVVFAFAGQLVYGLELRGQALTSAPHAARSCAPHASMCNAEAWPALQKELDELPVFVLANAKGEPLQHDADRGQPMTILFADLFRAEAELANANRLYPDLNLELLPVGLGDAVRRCQDGSAMLVPSQNELAAAGLDQAEAGIVPLFGCTKIMQPRRSNPELKAMPLFLSAADARSALDAALNASGVVVPDGMSAQGVGLDVLCIPLQKACELIVTGQETRFEFYAPTRSLEWVQDYARRRREAAGSKGGDGTPPDERDAEKQAMFETLIDQRQAMLHQTGGVMPGSPLGQDGGATGGAGGDAAD